MHYGYIFTFNLQLDVNLTQNVLLHKPALIVNVWILVLLKDVVKMHYVLHKITGQYVLAPQAIDLIQILIFDASHMSVSLILNAQLH